MINDFAHPSATTDLILKPAVGVTYFIEKLFISYNVFLHSNIYELSHVCDFLRGQLLEKCCFPRIIESKQ